MNACYYEAFNELIYRHINFKLYDLGIDDNLKNYKLIN